MDPMMDAAAKLALFGVRYPDAPIFPDLVEGPFVGYPATVATALAANTQIDLLKGTTAVMQGDYKLRTYAGVVVSGNPTGLLWIDSIGVDIYPGLNTEAMIAELFAAYSIVHVPSGSSRWQVVPLACCARVAQFATADTVTNETRFGGQPQMPYFRFPGGSWKVDLQSDQLYVMNTLGAVGPTFTTSFKLTIKMQGAWMTLARAQNLGLLGADVVCGDQGQAIPQVLGARKSLMQISGGGLTG